MFGLNDSSAGFTFDKVSERRMRSSTFIEFPWQMLHTMPDETFRLMLEVHNVAPFKLVRKSSIRGLFSGLRILNFHCH